MTRARPLLRAAADFRRAGIVRAPGDEQATPPFKPPAKTQTPSC